MLSHPRALTPCAAALAIAVATTTAHGQELPPLPPPPPYGGAPPPTAPPPPPVSSPSAAAATHPPPPAPPPDEVRFEPDQPGLALLQRSGAVPVMRVSGSPYFVWIEHGLAPVYSPICPGSCLVRMQPGPYQLALSKNGGRAIPALDPVVIRGPSSIRGHYVDRSGARAGGIALAIVGTVAGVVMIVLAADNQDVCDASGYCFRRTVFNAPLTIAGVGTALGSLAVGSVLAAQRDEAHLMVTPLVSWTRPEQPVRTATSLAPTVEGAALTMRF
jgi:hypothetical protein